MSKGVKGNFVSFFFLVDVISVLNVQRCKTRDILLSIVTNSKLTSSRKKYPILLGLIFLTSEGVFEKTT